MNTSLSLTASIKAAAEPITLVMEEKPAKVSLFPPFASFSTFCTEEKASISIRAKKAQKIESETQKILKQCQREKAADRTGLKKILAALDDEEFIAADRQAVTHHLSLIEELTSHSYSLSGLEQHLDWSLKLTWLQLRGKSLSLKSKMHAFCQQILQAGNYKIIKRGKAARATIPLMPQPFKPAEAFALVEIPI